MDFMQLARERYSCKKFDGRKVDESLLQQILEAGRLAPTAKNLQEQHVYILDSADALAKFDGASPCRYGASTVLLVAFDSENVFTYPGNAHDSGVEDAAIVATHMMLAAKSLGVDSCWVNFFDPDALAATLALPKGEIILMALDLGYPAEGTKPLANHGNRKALEETVTRL
ncbi:nitroreductase family protein [Olsenella uli]|uniref:nitroreductase family protein n=1 Tax=Olsenella uli TaxID=133926 RepID=UPI00044E99EB|nr:nitroreductase family protein [Olsenella uli]EUB32115.1 nitroreductase family protein [Olsenella uli MSTE5]MBS6418236.1 nitroreductase family protein [Olsenella uli]